MRVIITPDDDIMRRFGNQIGALGECKAHQALARAVNRVTTTVYGRVIKAIRQQSDIPNAIIRASVGKRLVKPGGGGALEGQVWAKGKPLSLKVFKARQLNFGVKAKWGGEWHRYQGAFMGPRPGVIAGRLNGHVFVRTSAFNIRRFDAAGDQRMRDRRVESRNTAAPPPTCRTEAQALINQRPD